MPAESGSAADYDRLRLSLGVPDGSRDLPVEKAILLENGFDELNAIDWDKGCYMGQELTARTRYRGLVRKRLMPVAIEGAAAGAGDGPAAERQGDRARCAAPAGDLGLALVRLEALGKGAAHRRGGDAHAPQARLGEIPGIDSIDETGGDCSWAARGFAISASPSARCRRGRSMPSPISPGWRSAIRP